MLCRRWTRFWPRRATRRRHGRDAMRASPSPHDLDVVARELGTAPLLDRGGLLKPGARREVLAAISRLRERGLRAHVVVLPRGMPLEPWHALWTRLGYDLRRDLLLLSNGKEWQARGFGLTPEAIHAALTKAQTALDQYIGRGLSAALDGLGAAA